MNTTYSSNDLERIAKAIGLADVGEIAEIRAKLDSAALWYRLESGSTRRPSPSKSVRQMKAIAAASRSLLRNLGIKNIQEAPDGPGEFWIMEILASVDGKTDDDVMNATARIGRFAEILDAVEAAHEIEQTALEAADDAVELGKFIPVQSREGDAPVNNWLAAIMGLYEMVSGKPIGTSVGKSGGPGEGVASGPLIRFVMAAAEPVGLRYSCDAWRSRIRTILR